MNMKATFVAFAAATSFVAGAAQATTISVSAFDITDWGNAVAQLQGGVVEDFENTGPVIGEGELSGDLSTDVGTFSSLGGTGSGSTCTESSGGTDCSYLSLFGPTLDGLNGQGNLVPDNGEWSLNADDTLGIHWAVELDGASFNRVIFGLRDAADISAVVEVSAGGETVQFSNLLNSNAQLIVVTFDSLVNSAAVKIENSNGVVNDSFSVDGAAVGVVPIPAAGFLLVGGLGALAAMRRRKSAA